AIEVRGCELVFLPAHSLDFTPIERAFSKTKSIPRRLGARAHDTLLDALLDALYQAVSAVTAQNAWGWFTSVGYSPLNVAVKPSGPVAPSSHR
ncbi:MAG TPA: hypothetical protein VGN32_17800, partial [Ktedonobacterales bacterium]|nr:hypothetical protein [Ktedonobacterales bacterium]